MFNMLEKALLDLKNQQKRDKAIEVNRLFANELNFTVYDKTSETSQKFEIYL